MNLTATTAHGFAAGQASEARERLLIAELIRRELAPRVNAIDHDGEYPQDFLRALGRLGGFAGVVSPTYGGSGKGNGGAVQATKQGNGSITAAITLPPLATVMFELDA